MQNNRTLTFNRLKVSNKKAIVEYETSLDLSSYRDMNADYVFITHQANYRNYIVVDSRGKIALFDKNGIRLKEVLV
jgi:hypothetical protein